MQFEVTELQKHAKIGELTLLVDALVAHVQQLEAELARRQAADAGPPAASEKED